MMSEQQFYDLIKEIQALCYDNGTAAEYAYRVGDLREEDAEGFTIVRNDAGEVVARLRLK